jgi:N-acyl-D-amino-acid deacylase
MQEDEMQFDTVIKGGMIIDGSGARRPFPADIGIIGDRIAAVGNLGDAPTADTIDATGKTVTPGFIDVHVHSELSLLGSRDQMAGAYQGITTQLTSPDGFGWAPLSTEHAQSLYNYTRFAYGNAKRPPACDSVAAYLDSFRGSIPINLCPQIPHCAVRLGACGWAARPATEGELGVMVDTVRAWMEAGACAVSLGLDYQPSVQASLSELVTLSQVVAEYGGIYVAHIRKQALGPASAWKETLEVARQAHIPVHVSHERIDEQTGPIISSAQDEGLDVSLDSYLYPAGMTHLSILLPLDVQAGSLDAMLSRMRDPEIRSRALPHLRTALGPYGDQTIGYTASGRFIGMTIAQAAASVDKTWEAFAYDLILSENGIETCIIPWPQLGLDDEEIITQTAQSPRMMVASDGIYNIPHPHPRGYGCFARILRRFVRERGILSPESAIYKMSGFPAERFGLADRGRVAPGMAADLAVFDMARFADQATWHRPLLPAEGIEWVLVNGQTVIADGQPTDTRPGRVLERHT